MNDVEMAAAVLRKDQRRIRGLAGLTIGLWLLAALVIPGFYFPFQAFIEPKVAMLEQHVKEKAPGIDAHFVAAHIVLMTRGGAIAAVGFLTVFTLTSLLAAISTIWLVLTVRRITLRQVQEGLAEISRQLKNLERPA